MDPKTRTRLLILVAVVIIIAAVGVVLLMGQQPDEPEPAAPVAQATAAPGETAVPETPQATAIPTQELRQIVIVEQNISRGQVIPPDAVTLRPWPAEAIPFNMVIDPDDVIGRIARTDLVAEQPILSAYLVDSLDQLADVGSDLAAMLPSGLVAVTVPIDRLTSTAYAIQPGDRVDVIVSLLFRDLDEDFQSALPNLVNLIQANITSSGDFNSLSLSIGSDIGGRFDSRRIPIPILELDGGRVRISTTLIDYPTVIRPAEEPRPRLLTHRTILDAQVMHLGDFPTSGRLFGVVASPTPVQQQQQAQQGDVPTPVPPRPDVVTLAVDPQEAVIIVWLIEARVPMTFVVRSAADRSRRITDPVTLDYIISEYNITVPRRNDFAIEPAIRSIRQLSTGLRASIADGQ